MRDYRTIFLLLTFLNTTCVTLSTAQVTNKFDKIAASKDFDSFKSYADGLYPNTSPLSYWKLFREITKDVNEGVFYFIPDNSDTTGSQYEVHLIVSSKKIIYCTLLKLSRPFDTVWVHKDEDGLAKLNSSFEKTFHAKLNLDELFVTDFAYGYYCGFVGTPPTGRRQIDEFVAQKNKEAIVNWLKSANSERQVYAVEGLFNLQHFGISLTQQELALIDFVKHKQGKINTCAGCIYESEDIRKVTERFTFDTEHTHNKRFHGSGAER